MLSRGRVAALRALRKRANRHSEGLFLVEGERSVAELLRSRLGVTELLATSAWIRANLTHARACGLEPTEVGRTDLERISSLKTPNEVVAVARIPQTVLRADEADGPLLVLEDVSDPGNMGTILRTADWFGVRHVVCSPRTVDAYNPKVVQATMGSLFRVGVHYAPLQELLDQMAESGRSRLLGADLQGEPLWERDDRLPDALVFGNEARGLSAEVKTRLSQCLRIPGPWGEGAESLNVGIAAGIFLAELRRREGEWR